MTNAVSSASTRPSGPSVTDLQIRNAQPETRPYKLSVGNGLLLQVMPNGSKRWRIKYRWLGREQSLSLGIYPKVSLKDARKKCNAIKNNIDEGIDPAATRRQDKALAELHGQNTFYAVSQDWLKIQSKTLVPAHFDRQLRRLEKYVYPSIGKTPVMTLTNMNVLALLTPIADANKIETAHRVRVVISQILRHAMFMNLITRDVAAGLSKKLPAAPERNHPALIEPDAVGKLLADLYEYDGDPSVKAAVRLTPLVMCRPGELRGAIWSQFDLDRAEWRFVTSKTQQDHIVPLPVQAVSILRELHNLTGTNALVFPGRSRIKSISENSLTAVFKRAGYGGKQTPHGFRAVARTMLEEQLGYPPHLCEHQLGHRVRDALGRAYNRSTHLQARREMLQVWANYLDDLRTTAEQKVEAGA